MTNRELAQDPNTNPEILKSLATDDDWVVRCWVARNPNTTPEILASLATDCDWDVRCVVARHPKTTLEILKSLATDDYRYVRYYAAHNPNATELVRRLFLMTQAQFEDVDGSTFVDIGIGGFEVEE